MWCFVSEPNGVIHEVLLTRDAIAYDCLEKVCERLTIVERDYFGLRYTNPTNGVEIWLNLRNKMADQLTGKAPFRLRLQVKFFVRPQELQQPITRDLFYISTRHHLNIGKYDLSVLSEDLLGEMYAFMAQAEHGGFDDDSVPEYSTFIPCCEKWSEQIQLKVEKAHMELEGMSPDLAKTGVLHILSQLPEYGVELFNVLSASGKEEKLTLSVRHDGLRIYRKVSKPCKDGSGKSEIKFADKTAHNEDTKDCNMVRFIPYEDISTVSYKGKVFTIAYGDSSSHNHSRLSFKLKHQHSTINLFRTFTEFHSFYQCNVVKKSVLEKCTRSSAGRIASFFKPHTRLGCIYLFDVIHTRRQAYNSAWKELHSPEKRRQSVLFSSERHFRRHSMSSVTGQEESDPRSYRTCHSVNMKRKAKFTDVENEEQSEPEPKSRLRSTTVLSDNGHIEELSLDELREVVKNLQDSRICHVCMDKVVSTAFCPCGHVVCCVECSILCKECPLCRTQITYAQRVFFS